VGVTADWQPATSLEAALREALLRGDHDGYTELLGTANLLLPLPPGTGHGRPGWTTWTVDGRVHVLAFTSAQASAACLGARPGEPPLRHRAMAYSQLAAEWPGDGWWLAIDPGLPIEAYLPPWQVTGNPPPPETPPDPDFTPDGETEAALLAAVSAGDQERYLRVLLDAQVLVPVPAEATTATVGADGFDWLTLFFPDGTRTVPVFTTPGRVPAQFSAARFVVVDAVDLVRAWRTLPWPLAVDPGTPIGAVLPQDRLAELAGWLAEAVPAGAGPRDGAVVLQKVLPPEHVARYVDGGYDRVGGLVHRAADVAHLRTPAALRPALAVPPAQPPIDTDARALHLLRWPAYRWGLYRPVPDPPHGVPAFTVASTRLPHGAELYRVDSAGAEELVAAYDADQRRWRCSGPAGGGAA
jgi:hypothetical protein